MCHPPLIDYLTQVVNCFIVTVTSSHYHPPMSVQCQVCSNPYSLEAIIQDAPLSGLKVTTSVPLSRLTAEETRGPGSRYDCESRGVTESLWRNLYFLSSSLDSGLYFLFYHSHNDNDDTNNQTDL